MVLTVIEYDATHEEAWDRFVVDESANGTFLQTRKFLNYHPEGRFQDASLLVANEKGSIVAVVPAAVADRNGKRAFVSHPGSTYGGPVIRGNCTGAVRAIEIVNALDKYLTDRYEIAEFKLTAPILCRQEIHALQYAFYYYGYQNYEELSTWIDLRDLTQDKVISGFDENKKRNLKKCVKHGLSFRELFSEAEIADFYRVLEGNLCKFDAKPVHTLTELLEFKNHRFPQEVRFVGVYQGEQMVAGSMLFEFQQTNSVHTQYLASDLSIREYSPSTFLYEQIIRFALSEGYQALSWGISTEERGKVLNTGLISNKESVGSQHGLNTTVYKTLKR